MRDKPARGTAGVPVMVTHLLVRQSPVRRLKHAGLQLRRTAKKWTLSESRNRLGEIAANSGSATAHGVCLLLSSGLCCCPGLRWIIRPSWWRWRGSIAWALFESRERGAVVFGEMEVSLHLFFLLRVRQIDEAVGQCGLKILGGLTQFVDARVVQIETLEIGKLFEQRQAGIGYLIAVDGEPFEVSQVARCAEWNCPIAV